MKNGKAMEENQLKLQDHFRDLDINKSKIDEICYGIAIHVDDKADFAGERTPFAHMLVMLTILTDLMSTEYMKICKQVILAP